MPTDNTIDRKLILGSAIFGIGWSLGGFCPGPSVAGFLTGHPNFVAFSYGMYLSEVLSALRRKKEGRKAPHWPLTILLGTVPAFFYFLGPRLFPMADAPRLLEWPLALSVTGGLGIGIAAILLYQFNGRVLGLSGIWRHVLDVDEPVSSRLPQLVFFAAFMAGATAVYMTLPAAFAVPPYAERALGWVFIGGFLVADGTRWANGCTSGHGICGVARLSVRSLVAVPVFMGAVFICLPLFNLLLGR